MPFAPAIPAAVTTALTVASAVVGAYGAYRQGQAQAAAAEYSAQTARNNAERVDAEQRIQMEQDSIDKRRLGLEARARAGEAKASATAAGLDPMFGSPADIIGDIGQAYKVDLGILGRNTQTTLERGDRQRADYLGEAAMHEAEAKSARQAGTIGALGSLLGGARNVANRWYPSGSAISTTPIRANYMAPSTPSMMLAPPALNPSLSFSTY